MNQGCFSASIDKFFKIEERGSSIRTELLGGLTTFLTMAYILFVNPKIMTAFGEIGDADLVQAVFLATALAAALGTVAMGLFANLPIAVAPGMGLNAFFAFSMVLGLGYSWEQALAAVLLSGVLYLIISASGIRARFIKAVPQSLKYAIGAAIGFFIAYIGLTNAGIIVSGSGTPTTLGNLANPVALLALFGIVLTMVLMALNIRAAVFFGLAGTALAGWLIGLFEVDGMPEYSGVVSAVPSLAPTFGSAFQGIGSLLRMPIGWFAIFAFLFMDFFDTSGTLMAVTGQMKSVTDDDIQKANIVDSSATIAGAILGASTTTSYIESLAGIGAGARTGLASVLTGALFILSIFLTPLLTLITAGVTAAAMVVVGTMMAGAIAKIEWNDWPVAVASFVTILSMTLTYSISDGIGFGFLTYIIAMTASGRHKSVSPVIYGAGILFVVYLWFLASV